MKLALLAIAVLTVTASAQEPRFRAPHVRVGNTFPPAEARTFRMDTSRAWDGSIGDPICSMGARYTCFPGFEWAEPLPSTEAPQLIVRTNIDIIVTCEMSRDDLNRVHDCVITEGHTLDEVMQAWQDQSRTTYEWFGEERQKWMRELQVIEDILSGKHAARKRKEQP